jgi:hypothetical protein
MTVAQTDRVAEKPISMPGKPPVAAKAKAQPKAQEVEVEVEEPEVRKEKEATPTKKGKLSSVVADWDTDD